MTDAIRVISTYINVSQIKPADPQDGLQLDAIPIVKDDTIPRRQEALRVLPGLAVQVWGPCQGRLRVR